MNITIMKQSKKKVCKQTKVKKVMKEFKNKTLKTAADKKVKNPKQAIAIALSEAKRKC